MKARSSPASLAVTGQVTKHTTVKWPIHYCITASLTFAGTCSSTNAKHQIIRICAQQA